MSQFICHLFRKAFPEFSLTYPLLIYFFSHHPGYFLHKTYHNVYLSFLPIVCSFVNLIIASVSNGKMCSMREGTCYINLFLPKLEPETRTWVQMFYVKGDPRKHLKEESEINNTGKREKPVKQPVNEKVTNKPIRTHFSWELLRNIV